MIAPEVWPFGQAEPYGEGIPGMRMVLAKFSAGYTLKE